MIPVKAEIRRGELRALLDLIQDGHVASVVAGLAEIFADADDLEARAWALLGGSGERCR